MRKLRIIKMVTIVIMMFCISINIVKAEQVDENGNYLNEKEIVEINKLYDYITEMKDDYDIIKDISPKAYVENYLKTGDGGIGLSQLISYIVRYTFREISLSMNLIVSMIIICMVSALLKNLHDAFKSGEVSEIAYFACYALIILIIGRNFYIGIDVARKAIIELTNFMAALMPIMMTLLASIGGFTQATLMDPIVIAITNISARLIADFIIPVIVLGFVLNFVNYLSKDEKVSNLSSLLNQIAGWAQGLMLTVFVGFITIRSVSSKAMDEVAVKTVKFAVDKFIPFVGKNLSDAFSTIAGYSFLIKNALGSLGLILIIMVVAIPIIKLLIMSFMFQISAALLEPVCEGRIIKCISATSKSLLLLMSCVLVVAIMCFIMVAIVAGTGNAIMTM